MVSDAAFSALRCVGDLASGIAVDTVPRSPLSLDFFPKPEAMWPRRMPSKAVANARSLVILENANPVCASQETD